MKAIKGITLKTGLLASGAMLAMFAFGPHANANPVRINFSGAAGSGYVDLTFAPDLDASNNYQPTYSQSDADNNISPPLSIYDPAGAQHITGANGVFTSGGNHVAIIGVIPTSPGVAPPGETLPKSFSWLVSDTSSHSYDNLFYADGSPLVCPPIGSDPYVFYGGFLDIFGAMFALDNGGVVGLWSDGWAPAGVFGPEAGVSYGMSVFTAVDGEGYVQTSSQFAGVTATVPEPDFMWLFGGGVIALLAWRRSAEARRPARSV